MMGRRVRNVVLRLFAVFVIVVAATPIEAQRVSFSGDVGLVSYAVPDADAARVETVLTRVLEATAAAAGPELPAVGANVRLLRGPVAGGTTIFILLIERFQRGVDYSVERLISERVSEADAPDVLREWRAVTRGITPTVLDMQMLHGIDPDAALRRRLELQLGPLSGGGQTADPDAERARVERLRLPSWAVDQLRFTIAEGGASARVTWSATIRNTSLLQPLVATVSIEFRDASGARLVGTGRSAVTLAAQEQQVLSGDVTMPDADARRIASANAVVVP